MKKYMLYILLLLIPLLTLGFFYYSAIQGIFLFKDSLNGDIQYRLEQTAYGASRQLAAVEQMVTNLAQQDVVLLSIVQFEKGRALDNLAAEFKRHAAKISHLERLRLVTDENRIVVDTKVTNLSGKKLSRPDQALLKQSGRKKRSMLVSGTDQLLLVVPCHTRKSGFFIGNLFAWFKSDLLLNKFTSLGNKERNKPVVLQDGVVFFNVPRSHTDSKKLAPVVSALKKDYKKPWYKNSLVILAEKRSSVPFIFAYAADRTQVGLPRIARLIIVLNGVILLGVLLLFLLRIRRDRRRKHLEKMHESFEQVTLDGLEKVPAAEAPVQPGKEQEPVPAPVAQEVTSAPPRVIQPEEKILSVAQVLRENHIHPPETEGYSGRERDPELQALIDSVTNGTAPAEPVAPIVSPSQPLQSSKPEPPEPTSVTPAVQQSSPPAEPEGPAFQNQQVARYWEQLHPLLQGRLDIGSYLLLEREADGVYRVRRSAGLVQAAARGFAIHTQEKLYQLILAQHKVLFIKDKVLENNTINRKLPGLARDSLRQMVMIPVSAPGEVVAVTVLFRGSGETEFDTSSLQEVRRISSL